ncbi:MAG: MBL fold metallo-hydrolase, partial [Alphaproteobacteria bacterium]
MKKILLGLLGLVVIAGAGIAMFRGAIVERAMPRIIEQRMLADRVAELPDGLHVFVCGAGSPMPNPNAGGPCLTVIAGKSVYMVDAGTGGVRTMALNGISPGAIKAVLLTHFHSDHIDGLGETQMLRWAQGGHDTRLPIYGPAGVEPIAKGLNTMYLQDFKYRIAHHGKDVMPPSGAGVVAQPFTVPQDGEAVEVLAEGDLKVIAFNVIHSPVEPAVGYLFTYKDR